MPEVFRYGWILFIAGTCANAAVWWFRAQKEIARAPELEQGYRRLIRGFLLYANVPWLVMGAGIVFGGVPTIFHFFDPRNGPWVVAWFASVVLLWILAFVWLFLKGGAEKMIQYPGLLRGTDTSPRSIKTFFLLCVAGGIVALVMMVTGNFPAASVLP
jgi:hypothetical protein